MKSSILSPIILARKNMTRMLDMAIKNKKILARMTKPVVSKDLSQMKIQARLRIKFRERVAVTVGEAIAGFR